MTATFASIFTGFDGAGIGARAAGFDISWGIELDDTIAAIARANGSNTITADACSFDPHRLPGIDWLHASPECQRASNATKQDESPIDVALGQATARYIEALLPHWFTLENVYYYRTFKAFRIITATLERLGYFYTIEHLNAADFGVPQTRRRLFIRAVKGKLVPHLPEPTPWHSWYDAIKDLLPTLPPSHFARWQIERLPIELATCLINQQDTADQYGNNYNKVPVRAQNEPAFTVTATDARRPTKIFICDSQNGRGSQKQYVTVRLKDQPMTTIQSNARSDSAKAYIAGRVVKMTPRANARLQSFPDEYTLPDNPRIAFKGIGNAVPPLETRAIGESFLTADTV